MTPERLGIDEYFIKIARLVAQRSTCLRRQVGAVLVRDNHILSTGYNGAPRRFPHCTPETCVRLNLQPGQALEDCYAVHAEANCLIQAALHGTSIEGETTLYCTTFPCTGCLKLLLNAGVKRIVYDEVYDPQNPFKLRLIQESGIVVEKYNEPAQS